MTDTEIRERAQAYISEALTEDEGALPAEERDAAVERVEAATRELLIAARSRREPVGC